MIRTIILLALLVVVYSCKEDPGQKMNLTGNIEGLKKGTIFLQKFEDSILTNIDSMQLKGSGRFELSAIIEHPEIFYLYLERDDQNELNDRIGFFGEKGNLTIKTKWDEFERKAKINGSKSNQEYQEYKAMLSNFNKREFELLQLQLTSRDSLGNAGIDSVQKLMDNNFLNRYRYVLNYGITHPDSYVSAYAALNDGAEANVVFLDSLHKSLSPQVAGSKYGIALQKLIATKKQP